MSRKTDLDNILRDPTLDAFNAEFAVRDRLAKLESLRKSRKLEQHVAAVTAAEQAITAI